MCICVGMYIHIFTSIFISTLYILNTEFTSIPLIPTQGVKLSLTLLLYIFVSSFLNSKKTGFHCHQHIYLFSQNIYLTCLIIYLISLYILNLPTLYTGFWTAQEVPSHYIQVCLIPFWQRRKKGERKKEERKSVFKDII